MAKRKKKTTRRRSRRVGATMALTPTNPMVKLGGLVLGFLAATPINAAIDKATGGKIDTKIVGGVQVGLGAFYLLSKGKKNLILTLATGVLAGAGVKREMTAFGIGGIGGYGAVPALGGYGAVPALGYARRVAGYDTPGIVGGYSVPGTMQGAQSVMGGVGNASNGSGIMSDGTSNLMG